MAQKDYYKILGVDKNATVEEIKSVYKKLARQWHPDKWVNSTDEEKKNAEEKFKEISEAYSVLSDKDKRQKYDMYGTVDGNPFEGFQSTGMGDLDDILNAFRTMHGGFGFGDGFGGFGGFGGNARRNGGNQIIMPEPLQIHLRVTISDIYNGTKKHIKYKYLGECSTCHGSGHLDGGKSESCPHCHGSGTITIREQRGFTTLMQTTTCPYCSGTGQVVTNPCGKCNGSGLEVQYDEIDVEVPIGAYDGAYMQLQGKGNCAKFHPEVRGNLAIIFDVQQDSNYQIINQFDLMTQVEVPILDCVTGGNITINTIDGKQYSLKIEPGTETGKTLVMRGLGLRTPNGRGNLHVKIKQRFPKSISKSDMKDLEKLKKTKSFS